MRHTLFRYFIIKILITLDSQPQVSSSLLSASMGYFDHPVIAAQVLSLEGQQALPGFFDRLSVLLGSLLHEYIKSLSTMSQAESWITRYPESDAPSLMDLERNASFGMYFAHYLFDSIRPTLPNTIDVGTIHCRPARYVFVFINLIVPKCSILL